MVNSAPLKSTGAPEPEGGTERPECDARDIALKALFLGPQAENASWLEEQFEKVLESWVGWRRSLFPEDGRAVSEADLRQRGLLVRRKAVEADLSQLLKMMKTEAPFFSPRYMGHMVSDISLPALLGHVAGLLHNPNNSSREASKVGVEIEKQAIGDLLGMVGFDSNLGRGHFTSGGTLANLEALRRAQFRMDRCLALGLLLKEKGIIQDLDPVLWASWSQDHFEQAMHSHQIEPGSLENYSFLNIGPWKFQELFTHLTGMPFRGPVVLAPASCHYSWRKAVTLLGFGEEALWPLELDENGRANLVDLAQKLERARAELRPVLMVVSVAGSTELGAVDPIDRTQDLLAEWKQHRGIDVWHHVDAAFGGYFRTMLDDRETRRDLNSSTLFAIHSMSRTDSITLDPHKLGFVPYSCGAFLAKDSAHYEVRSHSAPYLRTENGSPWIYTVEGSRAASGAAATWMANRSIGLGAGGYGRILAKGIEARRQLAAALAGLEGRVLLLEPQDLNILCFSLWEPGDSVSAMNKKTLALYKKIEKSREFSVSKTSLSFDSYRSLLEKNLAPLRAAEDDTKLVCLRTVSMNPFSVSKEVDVSFFQEFAKLIREHLA